MKKLSFLILALVFMFCSVASAQDDLTNRSYYSIGTVGQVPDQNVRVGNKEDARLVGLVKTTDGTICRQAGVFLAGNQCSTGVTLIGPGGLVPSVNPIASTTIIPDDSSENALKVQGITYGWTDPIGPTVPGYYNVGMTLTADVSTSITSGTFYNPFNVLAVSYMSGAPGWQVLRGEPDNIITGQDSLYYQTVRSIQVAEDNDDSTTARPLVGDEYTETDLTPPPFGSFSSGLIYGHSPTGATSISAPSAFAPTSATINWTNTYNRSLQVASTLYAADNDPTFPNHFRKLIMDDTQSSFAQTDKGLFVISSLYARDTTSGNDQEPLDLIAVHTDNKPNSLQGLVTASYLYARDSGNTFDPLGISDAGNLETLKAEIVQTVSSGTQVVPPATPFAIIPGAANRDVQQYTNVCVYVKNVGANPLSNAEFRVSPDDTNYSSVVWTSCDNLAAGAQCVRCVSGNAYAYINLRITSPLGTTIDWWVTKNNG